VPDLRGYWRPAHAYKLLRTREGRPLPFIPAAREVYEGNLAQRRKGDLSFDTMATLCQRPGIPRALTTSPFWIVQGNDYVDFLFDWNQVKRIVPIQRVRTAADGGQKPIQNGEAVLSESQHLDIYAMGSALGKWDGQVLVIDSKQFNDRTLLDDATPHSESLHVLERIRLVDRNALEDVVTVTDPEIFTAPWTTVLRFRRLPSNSPLSEDVCMDRVVTPQTVDAD
jgi:hypothetical protein